MTGKKVKDFYRFLRSIDSFTDGQASVLEWDETKLESLKIRLQPNDGAYEGGRFLFNIDMPENFPEDSPSVYCETELYHPNIDPTSEESNVCLNLFDEWNSSYGLRDVIQGLLFLMYNPNLDDPLSSYFGETLPEEEFEANVRASLRGEDVEGYGFPWNYYGKDPDMLTCKPKLNEDNNNEMTKDNGADEIDNGADKNDNGVDENDKEGAISDDTEKTRTESDLSEPKDINIMLEKVSELLLQHPEDDEDENKEKKEDTTDVKPEERSEQVDAANNDDIGENTSESQTENERDTELELNQNENSEETAEKVLSNETDETNEAQGVIAQSIQFQRQASKFERQCSVKDDDKNESESDATDCDIEDPNLHQFAYYLETFRTCSFVAPGYDHALNMIGAVCCYAYNRYTH